MNTKQLEKSAINVKAVLRRLYSYARHPSSFKRLGSALGFNHIYTVLRSVIYQSYFCPVFSEEVGLLLRQWTFIKYVVHYWC